MAEMAHEDVGAMRTPALLALSLTLASELSSRLASPSFLDELPRFPAGPEKDRSAEWGLYADAHPDTVVDGDRSGNETTAEASEELSIPPGAPSIPQGTLPDISVGIETLARSIDVARIALAGHTDRIFNLHDMRREVLGIPEGKSAFRNSHDYLREHLRIERRDAKKRIERSAQVMARRSLDHAQELPPRMPVLAEALHQADFDTSAADLVADTLSSARREAALAHVPPEVVDELLVAGEQKLVALAKDVGPGTLSKICQHWHQRFEAMVNPDGAEPNEAQLNAAQGLFYRGQGKGLHRWTVVATDAQHEILKTIASAGSNPRTAPGGAADASSIDGAGAWARQLEDADTLDTRTRGQRELDGLISALTGALALTATDTADGGSGARPQVMVTIDYQTLLKQTHHADATRQWISSASYTGQISPASIRQWACDADIIPVVLGGQGEVLDVGRSQRLFTRKLRRAIMARDGGCSAPGCSIPAPWCEAHHIEHWENGGPTSVDNGTLLCSHHHHAVHAGAWEISVQSGIPWFIPAPYLDPIRRPRRNKYWRPGGVNS